MLQHRSISSLVKPGLFAAALALAAGCGGGSGSQAVIPQPNSQQPGLTPTATLSPAVTSSSFAVVQSTHAGGTYNSTVTVKLPKAPIAGNVLVLFFEQNKTASFPYSGQVTWPSTETGSQWSYDGGTSETAMFSHIVQSGESGTYTLNVGGTGSGHEDYMVAEISGASSTQPINARIGNAVPAGATNFTLGAGMTPTVGGTFAVVFFTAHEGGLSWKSVSNGLRIVATNTEYTELYATSPVQTGTAGLNATAYLSTGSRYTGAADGVVLNPRSTVPAPSPTSTASPAPQKTASPSPSPIASQAPSSSSTSPYTLNGLPVYTAGDWFTTNLLAGGSAYAVNTIDPNSGNITNYFSSSQCGGVCRFNINGSTSTVFQNTPVNYATNSTPTYGNSGCSYGCFNDGTLNDDPAPGQECTSSCGWKIPWQNSFVEQGICSSGDCHTQVVNAQSGLAYDTYTSSGLSWNGSSFGSKAAIVHNLHYAYNSQINGGPDAAGIPMIGTFELGEDAAQPSINHALEVSLPGSGGSPKASGGYVRPATQTHSCASSCAYRLPMGARLRLNSSKYTCPSAGTNPQAHKVCVQMETYGIIIVDWNGGSNYFGPNLGALAKTGTSGGACSSATCTNPWNEADISALNGIPMTDFDVMTLGTINK